MEAHDLDNPFWHMLCHDLADAATGTALAKRCDPAIIPIVGTANHSAAACADAATLFNAGETAFIVEADLPEALPGFAISARFSFDQRVCQGPIPLPESHDTIIDLTPADLSEAQQLVDLTQPGPFFPGLFNRRHFVGIRQDGQLVAMAGERMMLPGYCEVSAVCTHPDWRGRGYASLLTSVIADKIWARGETPFLHVAFENTPAQRIYEAMGFTKRRVMTGMLLTRV